MSPDSIFLFPQSPGYQKRRSKQHSDGKKRVSFRQEPSQRIRSLRTNRDLPETWYSVRLSLFASLEPNPINTTLYLTILSLLSITATAS